MSNVEKISPPTKSVAPAKTAKGKKAKGAKKVQAKQAPAKAALPKTRPALYPDSAKLVAITKENPGRPGTFSHKVFAAIQKAKTVGACLEAVNDPRARKYLYWFVARGHAQIGG
ncbi:hypothetical protein SAMN05444161_2656 [Rhizobiales bacterium GAS191]|nr:hypothetical protein SAMN05444161_2656 [Rhizobiales bacterium GAS191]